MLYQYHDSLNEHGRTSRPEDPMRRDEERGETTLFPNILIVVVTVKLGWHYE